ELAALIKKLGLATERLRVGGIGRDHLVHDPQCRVVLALLLLLEGAGDLIVNRQAAPLVFFAAAAGTGSVGVHEILLRARAARGRIGLSGQHSGSAMRRAGCAAAANQTEIQNGPRSQTLFGNASAAKLCFASSPTTVGGITQ